MVYQGVNKTTESIGRISICLRSFFKLIPQAMYERIRDLIKIHLITLRTTEQRNGDINPILELILLVVLLLLLCYVSTTNVIVKCIVKITGVLFLKY